MIEKIAIQKRQNNIADIIVVAGSRYLVARLDTSDTFFWVARVELFVVFQNEGL